MFSMRPELAPLLHAGMVRPLTVNPVADARTAACSVDWADLAIALPDGGFPTGVIEVSAPRGLGGLTRIAASSVRSAQQADGNAWCAWIEEPATQDSAPVGTLKLGTLYAPGLLQAGVDLRRLLVVRPPVSAFLRTALKVTGAGAFRVIVVDSTQVPERHSEVWVRRIALLAEKTQSSVLLLTDSQQRRVQAWPVSLRLELQRLLPGVAKVRIGKDRYGRIGQESELKMGG
jgi:recombination protein RecA